MANFQKITSDPHQGILSFLDVRQLALCAQVHRTWKKEVEKDVLWKRVFPSLSVPPGISMKQYIAENSISLASIPSRLQEFVNRVSIGETRELLGYFPFHREPSSLATVSVGDPGSRNSIQEFVLFREALEVPSQEASREQSQTAAFLPTPIVVPPVNDCISIPGRSIPVSAICSFSASNAHLVNSTFLTLVDNRCEQLRQDEIAKSSFAASCCGVLAHLLDCFRHGMTVTHPPL